MTTARHHVGRITSRPRRPRIALLAAIVAGHLVMLMLLLSSRSSLPNDTVTFKLDFTPIAPRPVELPEPIERVPAAARARGGSPGAARERPPLSDRSAIEPAAPSWDVTPVPLAPLAETPLIGGAITIDPGRGGNGGSGTGTGSGVGPGDGSGAGSGGGYARAEWIERPSAAAYRDHWPAGYAKISSPVDVKLSCLIRPDGRPRRCDILPDMPHPRPFGPAAVKIIKSALVRPVALDGTVRWDLPVLVVISFDPPNSLPIRPML